MTRLSCDTLVLSQPCDTLVLSQVPFEELCLLLGPLLEALATSVASAGSGGRETVQDTTAAVVAFADGLLAVLSISVTLQTNIRKARPLSSFFFLCCLCHPQVARYSTCKQHAHHSAGTLDGTLQVQGDP